MPDDTTASIDPNPFRPVQYAVACFWPPSAAEPLRPPPELPHPPTLERVLEHFGPGVRTLLYPLYAGSRAINPGNRGVCAVLELTEGRWRYGAHRYDFIVQFNAAKVLHVDSPSRICVWLRTQGLPVTRSGTSVRWGVDGEHVRGRLGDVVVASTFGSATAESQGVAVGPIAIARNGGVAVGEARGALASDQAVAVAFGMGRARAGADGVAIGLSEFQHARAGAGAVAVAGFCGHAIAGPGGIAVADEGTVQAGAGGVLVVRYCAGRERRCVVGVVGVDGLRPDTPYRREGTELVEGIATLDDALRNAQASGGRADESRRARQRRRSRQRMFGRALASFASQGTPMSRSLTRTHFMLLQQVIASGNASDDAANALDIDIWSALPEVTDAETLAPLTEAQKRYYGSYWFESEVNEGGFHQFFLNKGATTAQAALRFLTDAKLTAALAALQRAMRAFPTRVLNGSSDDLQAFLCDDPDIDAALRACDDDFFALDDAYYGAAKLARFRLAAAHPREFFPRDVVG
jgi:hypothetical protein